MTFGAFTVFSAIHISGLYKGFQAEYRLENELHVCAALCLPVNPPSPMAPLGFPGTLQSISLQWYLSAQDQDVQQIRIFMHKASLSKRK